jgi:hypothetical protein
MMSQDVWLLNETKKKEVTNERNSKHNFPESIDRVVNCSQCTHDHRGLPRHCYALGGCNRRKHICRVDAYVQRCGAPCLRLVQAT